MPHLFPTDPQAKRRQRVQSAETGMTILKALARLGGAASLTAIAAESAESAAKVHRYLSSLASEGLVAQHPATQHYHLGPEAVRIGLAALRQCDPVRLGEAVGYRSAGTVEFVYDTLSGAFYFLEVNTRLQVEHGVTEEVTGVDLVEWMVKEAAGELDLSGFKAKPKGASMQVRLYAEDPGKDFQPAAGVLTEVVFPADARIETWVERGSGVPPFCETRQMPSRCP